MKWIGEHPNPPTITITITSETKCECCGYEQKWVWVSKNERGKLLCDSCGMVDEWEHRKEQGQ